MEGAQPLRYSRRFLLALQESPLVKKPDDLPAIETLLAKTESPRKDGESRSRATAEGNEDSSPARPSRLGERGMVFGPPKMNFVSTRTTSTTTSESSAPRSLRRGSAVEDDGSSQEPRRRAPLVVGPSSSSTFPRAPRYSAEEKFAKGPTRAPREPGASDKLPVAPTKGGDKGPKTTQMQPLPPPVDHGDGGLGRRPKLRAEHDDDGKHARSDERSSAARKGDIETEKFSDRQPAWMSYDINDKAHMNLAASDGLDDIQRFKLEMSKKTDLTKDSPKEPASSPKIEQEVLDPTPQTPVAKDDGPNVLDVFIAKERGLTEVPLRLGSDAQAAPAGGRMQSDSRAVSRFQQLFAKETGPREGIQVDRSFQDYNQGRVPQGVPANAPFRPSPEEMAFGARDPRSDNMLSVLLPNVGNNLPRHVDVPRMVSQGAPREFFAPGAQPPADNEIITKSILDTLKGKGNAQEVGLPVGLLPPGAKVYTESEILRMHGVDGGPPIEDRRVPPVARRMELESGTVQPQQRPDDPTTIFSGRRFVRPEVQGGDSGEMKRIMGMLAQSSIQVQGADRYEAMLAAQAQAQPPRFSQNPAYGRPGVPMQMGGMNQPPYGNPPAGYGPGGPGPMMSRPVMVPRPGPAFLQLQQQEQQLQQQLQLQQLQRQQLQQQQLQQQQLQQQRAQMGSPPSGFFGGALPPDVSASLPFHQQLRGPSPPVPNASGIGAAGPYGRPPPQYFQPNPNDLSPHQHGYGGPVQVGAAPRAGSVRLDEAAMAGLVQAGGGMRKSSGAPTPPHGLPTHEMLYKGRPQQGEPPMMGGAPNGVTGQPSQVRLDDMPFGPPPGGYFQSPLVGNGGGGGGGLPPFYRQ
ncbi:hypothetical protein HK405_011767 [Cladochytrium tenue]|nr:hypothetical protein HK405_011767 [Cladochytrium tenue]